MTIYFYGFTRSRIDFELMSNVEFTPLVTFTPTKPIEQKRFNFWNDLWVFKAAFCTLQYEPVLVF